MIADLFDPSTRGLANGILSWGVYIGYGLAFIIGNYVPEADWGGYGWRPVYLVGCTLGIPIAILVFLKHDPR